MTKALLRKFFLGFANDPDIYSDMSRFSEYSYCEADVDARWEKQQKLGWIYLAVILNQIPIGKVILKDIDAEKQQCALRVHLRNNSVKNHGYGTQAEILTLKYDSTFLT
ncbi:MAG: hypothetical protein ACI3V5_03245 [Faecousia sp.]